MSQTEISVELLGQPTRDSCHVRAATRFWCRGPGRRDEGNRVRALEVGTGMLAVQCRRAGSGEQFNQVNDWLKQDSGRGLGVRRCRRSPHDTDAHLIGGAVAPGDVVGRHLAQRR